MTKKERYDIVLKRLNEKFPNAGTALYYDNPFQLLIAVILSAQCTDERVNMVTPNLFKAFPTAEAMSKATEEEIFYYIKSISYPNSKAKYLSNCSKRLVETYNSVVPNNLDDLQTLQGVGRKTANVILGIVFNKATMPVDTHVFRVSNRIGLVTNAKNVRQTEEQLIKNLKDNEVMQLHHQLLLQGRYVCKSIKPKCLECNLTDVCKYYNSKKKEEKQNKNK